MTDLLFQLDSKIVDRYRDRKAPFGWHGLGRYVYERTYARWDNPKLNGAKETWVDTTERVINGMYTLQKQHAQDNEDVTWDEAKAQRSAAEAFDLMFDMKWSPPGRGLWMMGTPFVHERNIPEALNNCAFISSKYLPQEKGDQFKWVMNHLMLGVGVGFDVFGAGSVSVYPTSQEKQVYVVEDTRQGWAGVPEAIHNSYLVPNSPEVILDTSKVRGYGEIIKGFGGVASGPAPLELLAEEIKAVYDRRAKSWGRLSATDICDVMNLIGKCVIAGNVRRSAEIAIGPETDEFLDLKNPEVNSERMKSHGWASNNTVRYDEPSDSIDYTNIAERIHKNGEPGIFWLGNAKKFERMNGKISLRPDLTAEGMNPCGEQMLAHRELCTLIEIYLPRIESKEDFGRVIKFAYLYGKSVTLANKHIEDEASRKVMTSNMRIGLSTTGYAQFEAKHVSGELEDWLDYGYQLSEYFDLMYSNEWLKVPTAIRRTSVKPSGTVSLLPGVTPGVHYPISRFYKRRVQVSADSDMVDNARAAGYTVEDDALGRDVKHVIFPVDVGEGVESESEVSLVRQVDLAITAAKYWADNSPSFTGTFDPEEVSVEDIAELLSQIQWQLKGVSMLPMTPEGVYAQMPYETFSESEYLEMVANIDEERLFSNGVHEHIEDEFCDTDACDITGDSDGILVEAPVKVPVLA